MTYKQIIKFFSIISYFLIFMGVLSIIFDNSRQTAEYLILSAIIEVRIHLFKIQREINEEKK
jgi:hypothetical protein